MITDIVVGGWLAILRALLLALPSLEVELDGVTEAVADVAGGVGWLNGYFPVATLFVVLLVVWGWRLVLFAYSALRELWDALPLT